MVIDLLYAPLTQISNLNQLGILSLNLRVLIITLDLFFTQSQMQPQKRRQASQKIKSSATTDIDWILNLIDAFPRQELEETNLRSIPSNAVKRLIDTQILSQATIHTYIGPLQKFAKSNFCLYPNMLVQLPYDSELQQSPQDPVMSSPSDFLPNSSYLILSTCTLDKKILQYKEFQAHGLILQSQIGQCFLFFDQSIKLIEWYKLFKKYCKITNFLSKYTVREKQSLQNVFACVKNKNNRVYTVEIFRVQDVQRNSGLLDSLMNEVNILMNFKHPSLLTFLRQYEDQHHIYLLYEYWIGDPLYKLQLQGFKMQTTQQANILYQVIKLLKVLHRENIYHGFITPQSIILLRTNNNQPVPKVILKNFAYREQSNFNSYSWLGKRLPQQWVPPEIIQNQSNIDPLKIDSYLLGCTLFYLMSYTPGQFKNKDVPFARSVEHFKINYAELLEIHNEQHQQSSVKLSIDKHVFGQSQMSLLLALLNPDPKKRMSVIEASKHHWFINQKSKMNTCKKEKILPSLKTILELRDSGSFELASHRLLASGLSIGNTDSESDQEELMLLNTIDHDNVHRICREDSFLYMYMKQLRGAIGIKHPRNQPQNIEII